MAGYCHCFDAADFTNWLGLFTDDGVFDRGERGVHRGKAQLREFLELIPVPDGTTRMMHFVSNEIIRVDGDQAHAMSYVLVVRPDGPRPLASWLAGRYEDHLVRQDGQWRFRHRKVLFDYVGEMSQ